MEQELLENLDHPEVLEHLFHSRKSDFEKAFAAIYEEHKHLDVVRFWRARLHYEVPKPRASAKSFDREFIIVLVLCLLAGTAAKILIDKVLWKHSNDTNFGNSVIVALKTLGFALFPPLCAYFLWKRNSGVRNYLLTGIIFALSCMYINLLPNQYTFGIETPLLACLFLPFFFWSILGLSHMSYDLKSSGKRLLYLKFNGDLVVFATILFICGGILTITTLALFLLIKVDISGFYSKWVLIYGAFSIPLVASYITESDKSINSQISPIVARIFSPLTLVTLAAYLIVIVVTRKNPYQERECLIEFNFVLIGVMALIVFSITGTEGKSTRFGTYLLFLLCLVTIFLNIIALSAVAFRIREFGTSPDRFAVLGSNILVFVNLILISIPLFKSIKRKTGFEAVETSVTRYLPLYAGWSFVVVFLFPVLFRFK